jgi:aldose 1-epimerase
MTEGDTNSLYKAEVINDPKLGNTEVIVLSYTEPGVSGRKLVARITPDMGSNLYSFSINGQELLHCELEKLLNRGHTGVFVLWPFPNRVRDRRYSYKGQKYSLAGVHPSNDPNLVHGLVYDRSWEYQDLYADSKGASVTTFVEMEPGCLYYASYPFDSRLSLTYTLTNTGITVSYAVHNKGKQTLPHGFALHPYLRVLSRREDTLVTLPAAAVMEADELTLPTGRLLNVHSGMYAMFDLNEPTPISQLKLDHVYTRLPVEHEAFVNYAESGLRMHISTSNDFTHSVIYTPAGEPYFCFENQTCSTDAINLYQHDMQDIAHLLEIPSGETGTGFIHYAVEDWPVAE